MNPLQNVWKLTRRRLRHGWRIHLSALVLTAFTCAAYLLYQSYLQQVGATFSQQVSRLELISDVYLDLPEERQIADLVKPTGSWRSRPYPQLVAAARRLKAATPLGELEVMAIQPQPAYGGPHPEPGQIIVADSMAEHLGLQVGQQLDLYFAEANQTLLAVVSDTYSVSPYAAAAIIDAAWLAGELGSYGYNRFLFNLPGDLQPDDARTVLQRFYPDGLVIDQNWPVLYAQYSVDDAYSSMSGVLLLVFVFLGLGVLTALLLSFLDSKRELSVLKSVGLTPGELWGLFTGAGLVTAAGGIVLGIGLTIAGSRLMMLRGVNLPISAGSLPGMLAYTTLAYATAIALPAGLARRATVNQLLFDQPIPLLSCQVTGLRRRHPVYEAKIAQGWQFLRVDVIDGKIQGFVFKRLGDRVKKGEVVAYAPGWWGLTYTEFVAKIDGTVQMWTEEIGIMGIKPELPWLAAGDDFH